MKLFQVRVDYVGRLAGNNMVIDQNNSKPFEFYMGTDQFIKGLEEGILGMMEGWNRRITIPSLKSYGETGCLPMGRCSVPANSTLVYEVTFKSF